MAGPRCSIAVFFVLCGALALADDVPRPYAGWRHVTPGAEEALRRPPPLPNSLPIQREDGFERTLRDLLGAGQWERAASTLDRRARSETLRGAVVRGRGAGGVLLGANEDARRRLRRLPEPAWKAYQGLRAAELEALAARSDDAALRALVREFSGSDHSGRALTLLGERAFERGDMEAAALAWRLAREARGVDLGQLERRLLKVRARPTDDVYAAGAVGVAPPAAARIERLRLRWTRPRVGELASSAVTACARRVYFVEGRGVFAAARADGRLIWRVSGAGQGDRLLLHEGVLVHASAASIRGLDARSGAIRYTLPLASLRGKDAEARPSDRCASLGFAADGGVIALLALGHRWQLLAFDRSGAIRWRTTLWETDLRRLVPPPIMLVPATNPDGDACTNPEDTQGECPSRGRFQAGVHPEKERRARRPAYLGVYRTLLGDGQLAVVGERIFLTADGFVAALGVAAGDLIWLRDRLSGLEVGGEGTVRVAMSATAFAVEAVTAAGQLVRLDPVDGSSLHTPAAQGDVFAYRLSSRPLVLGWRSKMSLRLTAGADAADLGALDAPPLWPGTTLNGTLALPTPSGLVLANTVARGEMQRINWPDGPAHVTSAAGVLLLTSARGLSVVEPGAALPEPTIPAQLSLEHLADTSWQVRAAARSAAEARLRRDPGGAILGRLQAMSKRSDLEAATAAQRIVDLTLRRRRWAAIAPGVSLAEIKGALADRTRAGVSRLITKVKESPEATAGLAAELLEVDGLVERRALLALLLRVERRARGRLVALVRTSPDPALRRAGAEQLVALAMRGGSARPLSILVRHELSTPPGGAAVGAIIADGDAELWARVSAGSRQIPFDALQQWFGQNPGHDPDPAALLRALKPFFESLRGS